MIKAVIKFLVLFAIIITVLECLNPLFAKPHFFTETMADFEKQTEIDLVFFGNSHAHFSYDPRIFEKELGVTTFNISSPSQRLISTQATVDLVLQKHKPTLAIVDLFGLSLQEPPNNEKYKNFQSQVLDYIPWSKKKAMVLHEVYGWNDIINGAYPVLRNHTNWSEIELIKKRYKFPTKQDYYKGFASYTTILGPEIWKQAEQVYARRKNRITNLTEQEIDRIDTIIDQFKKSDVEVLFITAPDHAHNEGVNYQSYIEAIKTHVLSRNYNFLDLAQKWDDIGLEKNDFRDFNHLNSNGAIKTSTYLASYLKEHYEFTPYFEPNMMQANRYAVLDNLAEPLFMLKQTETLVKKTGGIEAVTINKKNHHQYEVLLFVNNDTITTSKAVMSFEYSPKNALINKMYNFNNLEGRVQVRGEFKNDNLIHYKGKNFFYMSFYWPHSEIKSVRLYGGKKRNVLLFEEDNINLETPLSH